MALPATEPATAQLILDAARTRLLSDGYSRLSTRKVAQEAGVPLSQVHYHFGSKGGMVLALLEAENERRLARQAAMYSEDVPLWRRYERACDFLEDDLESGFVRVLQEMIAAGWSTPEIGDATREMLRGWHELLTEVATEAAARFGRPRPVLAIRSCRPHRQRLHRGGGVAAAGIRPQRAADQSQPAPDR